jgi:hypothetical protein
MARYNRDGRGANAVLFTASSAIAVRKGQMAGIYCNLSRNRAGVRSAALAFATRAMIRAERI